MTTNEILLCKDVRAKVDQIVSIVEGGENKRVTVQLVSDQPDQSRILKDYYVWIDPEYATKQGYLKLDEIAAIKIALSAVQKQFENNDREMPIEDGIYLSNNEEIIVDPKSFQHPLEMSMNE